MKSLLAILTVFCAPHVSPAIHWQGERRHTLDKLSSPLLSGRLAGGLAFAALLSIGSSAQADGIYNLRFVDVDRNLTEIGPDSPVSGLVQGTLSGELQFQSDLINPSTGLYTYLGLAVMWRIESPEGVIHFGNPEEPGFEWFGPMATRVGVTVPDFDSSTGVGTALFRLPIGRSVREGGPASATTPYAHLPEGATLSVALGWEKNLQLDPAGVPQGALVEAATEVPVAWPEVYVISSDFISEVGIDDVPRKVVVCLKTPTVEQRTFKVSVTPGHRASVLSQLVSLEAGSSCVEIEFVPLSKGDVRFLVHEGGSLVAKSDYYAVEPLMFIRELGASSGFALGGANGAVEMEESEFLEKDEKDIELRGKLCVPGYEAGGPSQPVYKYCLPCGGETICPGQPPTGQQGPPMVIYRSASCTGDPGYCLLSLVPPSELYTYRYTNSDPPRVCRTTSVGVDIITAPFGVGAGTSGTITSFKYETCCNYEYDPMTSSGAFTSGGVCPGWGL